MDFSRLLFFAIILRNMRSPTNPALSKKSAWALKRLFCASLFSKIISPFSGDKIILKIG
jgi:hypothetical protein